MVLIERAIAVAVASVAAIDFDARVDAGIRGCAVRPVGITVVVVVRVTGVAKAIDVVVCLANVSTT